MKRLLIVLFVLLAAGAVEAQEVYTLNATANQADKVTRGRTVKNRNTCRRFGLAVGCTQAQACTAANAAGGASCTAAQARAAGAEIFATNQTFVEGILRAAVADFVAQYAGEDRLSYCKWWDETANQTQRDAECTKSGETAGCSICP